MRYAFLDVWADLAGWFLAGLLIAAMITVFVPDTFFTDYLGQGISSMLIMLAVGIPIYICASASTPVAAALVMKGVSPGTALVFLLAGPATNMASLSVITRILGKRGVMVYLSSLALCALACGFVLDMVYAGLGVSAAAMAGKHVEFMPDMLLTAGAVIILLLSVIPVWRSLSGPAIRAGGPALHSSADAAACRDSSCGVDKKESAPDTGG